MIANFALGCVGVLFVGLVFGAAIVARVVYELEREWDDDDG